MKRGIGVAIVVLVAMAIAIVVCVRLGVFSSSAQGKQPTGGVPNQSDYTETGWTFPILFPSADRSTELFHEWERVERESGYALAQIDVYSRGWSPGYLNASTYEQFLVLGESDCITLTVSIRSSPDLAALGLTWDTDRVQHLLGYLDEIGVEGLDGIKAEAMLTELAAGRPFVHVTENAARMNGKK